MIINVGTVDRALRVVVGVGIITFAAFAHGYLRLVGIAGVILVVTGVLRFCPAYWLLRIKTIGRQAT